MKKYFADFFAGIIAGVVILFIPELLEGNLGVQFVNPVYYFLVVPLYLIFKSFLKKPLFGSTAAFFIGLVLFLGIAYILISRAVSNWSLF